MSRPNLFLVGAMKSGTTTLHDLLATHPQIVMSDPKEPCYFVEPEQLRTHWPEMWRRGYWQDERAYLALFPDRPGALYFGESSTDYSKAPRLDGVVDRMARYSPQARIVYLMRDPVQRSISHYWHMVELRGETRAPLQAIQADPHYTEVSDYARQLRPYLDRFGPGQVYTLTFETLRADPAAALRALCAWLGVDAQFEPTDLRRASNVTPATVRQQRAGAGALVGLRHSALWDAVGPLVPAAVRRLGVALVERPVAPKTVDLGAVEAHLRRLQQPQARALSALLGRDFPEWKTLYPG